MTDFRYNVFYMFHEEMRHPALLPAGTMLFWSSKEAAKAARFYGVEIGTKRIFVHKVLFTLAHTEPAGIHRINGRIVKKASLAGSTHDLNYPKLLKVQVRHAADYVEHKMLLSKETLHDAAPRSCSGSGSRRQDHRRR